MSEEKEAKEKATKTMKLTFMERGVFKSILPQKGSFLEQLSVKEILDKIDFSKEEIEKYTQPNGLIKQNMDLPELEIELGKSEVSILKDVFAKHDAEKTITPQSFSIMIKIKEL